MIAWEVETFTCMAWIVAIKRSARSCKLPAFRRDEAWTDRRFGIYLFIIFSCYLTSLLLSSVLPMSSIFLSFCLHTVCENLSLVQECQSFVIIECCLENWKYQITVAQWKENCMRESFQQLRIGKGVRLLFAYLWR